MSTTATREFQQMTFTITLECVSTQGERLEPDSRLGSDQRQARPVDEQSLGLAR